MPRNSSIEQAREGRMHSPGDENRRDAPGLLTVSNLLSAMRLIGSPLLIPLAWSDQTGWWLCWFLMMLLSDWLDGKLAKRLGQETATGAKLDSIADVTFYVSVLGAMLWLQWPVIVREWIWIGVAVSSYILSLALGWIKYQGLVSYHTRMAKTSWLLIGSAVVAGVFGWTAWPLRVAMTGVVVTNLEAVAITLVLPRRRVNVLSLRRAIQIRRQEVAGDAHSIPASRQD